MFNVAQLSAVALFVVAVDLPVTWCLALDAPIAVLLPSGVAFFLNIEIALDIIW